MKKYQKISDKNPESKYNFHGKIVENMSFGVDFKVRQSHVMPEKTL